MWRLTRHTWQQLSMPVLLLHELILQFRFVKTDELVARPFY